MLDIINLNTYYSYRCNFNVPYNAENSQTEANFNYQKKLIENLIFKDDTTAYDFLNFYFENIDTLSSWNDFISFADEFKTKYSYRGGSPFYETFFIFCYNVISKNHKAERDKLANAFKKIPSMFISPDWNSFFDIRFVEFKTGIRSSYKGETINAKTVGPYFYMLTNVINELFGPTTFKFVDFKFDTFDLFEIASLLENNKNITLIFDDSCKAKELDEDVLCTIVLEDKVDTWVNEPVNYIEQHCSLGSSFKNSLEEFKEYFASKDVMSTKVVENILDSYYSAASSQDLIKLLKPLNK